MSFNIIVKGKENEKQPTSRRVASQYQVDALKEHLEDVERTIKNGRSEGDFSRNMDVSGHIEEAQRLKKAIHDYSPVEMEGKLKDEKVKKMNAIKNKFSELAPTAEEMRNANAFNINKNKNWLNKEHDFDGVKMTGKQAEREYQTTSRSLGEDPMDILLENFRRQK